MYAPEVVTVAVRAAVPSTRLRFPRSSVDAYTTKTREWLERRYDETAPDGVYLPHQPIYGFHGGYAEPWLVERYARTVAILRVLERFRFDSCLDAGAAEGYLANLIATMLGGRVVASDLAETAAARAREIYGIEACAADVHDLPFGDEEFDVVVCSETLEHVADVERATAELIRVARAAVVITVPHERGIDEARAEPHGHIHAFDVHSFDHLSYEGSGAVRARRIVSPMVGVLGGLIEGTPKERRPRGTAHRMGVAIYNAAAPLVALVTGERTAAWLVELDRVACAAGRAHRALLFVVVKDPTVALPRPRRHIRARDVLASSVPLHRPAGRPR